MTTRKKKSRSNHQKIIKQIKNSPNLTHGISHIKISSSYEMMEENLTYLLRIPFYKSVIQGIPFPSLNNLGKGHMLFVTDEVEKEIYWNILLIKRYSNQINEFLKLKTEYETHILAGDYESAKISLSNIEESFGYSLWLIENRISLLEEMEGLEGQKEFINRITNDENINGLVRYLVRYYSLKAEKNVSANKYDNYIKELEQEYYEEELPLSFHEYFQFKLNLKDIKSYRYEFILAFESRMSIIDRYLSFVKICNHNACDSKASNLITDSLKVMKGLIKDSSLNNLSLIYNITSEPMPDEKSLEILNTFDLYTKGNYKECKLACEIIFEKWPGTIEIYEIYVKTIIYMQTIVDTKDKSLYTRILSLLHKVALNNTKTNEAYLDVLKIIHVHSNQSWSQHLRAVLENLYLGREKAHINKFVYIGHLSSNAFNPILVNWFKSDYYAEKFLINIEKLKQHSETVKLYKSLKENDLKALDSLDLPKDRLLDYKGRLLMLKEDNNRAFKVYQRLYDSKEYLTKTNGIIGLISYYMKTDLFNEALDLIVESYFENENIYIKLPVKEILDLVEEDFFSTVCDNISLSIVYDIYSKYISLDRDTYKSDAYEDFLSSHSLSKPSELLNIIDQIDKKKLIYFLKNICVFNVMDNSIEFDNTEEVEQERILVCQLLSKIDENSKNEYLEEIKSITQKLMIKKGIREIEKSKIYVDVEGIKQTLEKSLKESFIRYQSFNESPFDQSFLDYIVVNSNAEDGITVEFRIPKNEKQGLFAAMVLELRDNFVSSDEYGLDGYLSVGIRHGTLSGQLRGTLESEHLITQKDNVTDEYYPNEYWDNVYSNSKSESTQKVKDCLAHFSKEIDNLIDLLKNTWIQIKTENKNSSGLFNFQITYDELKRLESSVDKNTSYEEFINKVLEMLWQKTENSLTIIRSKISIDLKEKFNKSFNDLQQKVNSLNSIDVSELNSKIATAKTTTQYELDKIASWFTRGKTSESSDYSLELPIDISLEMIKNIYTKETLRFEKKETSSTFLKGKTLKSFVDICFILFDNIIKHNNKDDSPPKVWVELIEDNGILEMKFTNEINPSFDIVKGNRFLKEKLDLLHDGSSLERVSKEGGTGFLKVKKIISIDLNCEHDIYFEFLDDSHFTISVEIDAKGLLV